MAKLTGLKERHLQILSIAQAEGRVTRKQISEKLALPLPTVIRLVADLLDSNYLVESASEIRSTPGRPNTPVRINGRCAYALGIDLHFDSWSWALVDAARTEIGRGGPYPAPASMTEQGIAQIVDDLRRETAGLGLSWDSIKSMVFAAHTIVTASGDLFDDHRDAEPTMNLNAVASSAANKHCVSDDPARVSCEVERDAAQDGTDAGYLLYGESGHGLGIVALGQVLQSDNGICGEIGHLAVAGTMTAQAPLTLMELTNGALILDQARSAPWADNLPRQSGSDLTLSDLFAAARNGHDDAIALLCHHAEILAPALASAVSLIGCETLVIGGVWENAGETVRACFVSEIRKWVTGAVSGRIKVRYATHGTQDIALGAARAGARQIWQLYPANF